MYVASDESFASLRATYSSTTSRGGLLVEAIGLPHDLHELALIYINTDTVLPGHQLHLLGTTNTPTPKGARAIRIPRLEAHVMGPPLR